MLNTTQLADKAHELGREHGSAIGSPQIMDMEPSPLSGEWADSPTPQTLADELELDEQYRGSELDQLCTDYELGFSQGYWDEVIRMAKVYA